MTIVSPNQFELLNQNKKDYNAATLHGLVETKIKREKKA